MNTAVCTLFEGDYHYGLGALVNSLYFHGFRGVIWAGYRGNLPPWVLLAKIEQNYQELTIGEDCLIRFIPLSTTSHFTNYKPHFMQALWEKYCPDAEALFYFDPDIAIKCHWSFFQNWVKYGIALCQNNVDAYMPANHPVRLAWKKFAEAKGYQCHQELNQYFNGGFIGLCKKNQSALTLWQEFLELSEETGLKLSNAAALSPSEKQKVDRTTNIFVGADQDTLNLVAMVTPHELSTVGPEGMDFIPGGFTMSHAIGKPKPWQKRMTFEALGGRPPTMADKSYWRHAQTPIQIYSKFEGFWKQVDLLCGSAIGRLTRRV